MKQQSLQKLHNSFVKVRPSRCRSCVKSTLAIDSWFVCAKKTAEIDRPRQFGAEMIRVRHTELLSFTYTLQSRATSLKMRWLASFVGRPRRSDVTDDVDRCVPAEADAISVVSRRLVVFRITIWVPLRYRISSCCSTNRKSSAWRTSLLAITWP